MNAYPTVDDDTTDVATQGLLLQGTETRQVTFYTAATESEVDVGNYPFATIDTSD